MSENPNSPIILTRPEQPALYAAIHEVHRAAFNSEEEPNLVAQLRQLPEHNPKLSIMALFNGQVVGHILFSKVTIEGHEDLPVLGLGPLAVLPDFQRQMIGSALMYEGLENCRRVKAAAVVVLGHPDYYPRFGFVPAKKYRLTTKFDPSGEHFFVQELLPHSLDQVSGAVHYSPIFG